MRAYKIFPLRQIKSAGLSKAALKRLYWFDWYRIHGNNISLTCRHFGISRDTFYHWKRSFKKYNLRTLEDHTANRRPHKLREMTTDTKIMKRIYEIRLNDLEKSKYEIQAELLREGITVGRSAIQKVINRHSELLNTQHRKKLTKHRNYKIARIKAARELKTKDLGSLVMIDTKHLYVLGIRFYLFVAIDCKSRYGFIWCYKTGSSQSAADFLKKVINYLPFTISATNTDNGSEYLLNFHKLCQELDLMHYFTHPYTPKMNNQAERLIQTAEYEFFNWQYDLLPDIDEINKRCNVFNFKYNHKRFHQSLGYRTPNEYVINYLKEKGGELYGM